MHHYELLRTVLPSEIESEIEICMKSSCCGKCSNINCIDYGECNCFDTVLEQRREFIEKMIKDGELPFSSDD